MNVDEKMESQKEECEKKFITKAGYYKSVLKNFLMSLGVVTTISIGIVAWSYTPIRDIAVLKYEVKNMNDKLDKVLKNKNEKVDNRDQKSYRKEINMDSLSLCKIKG